MMEIDKFMVEIRKKKKNKERKKTSVQPKIKIKWIILFGSNSSY